MSPLSFNFSEETASIKISGENFENSSLLSFLSILGKINKHSNFKNIKIIGNFNSKFLCDSFFSEKRNSYIDKTLNNFKSLSENMEQSKTLFTAEINGIVQGPAMEIALKCNYLKAKNNTLLKLDQTNYGLIPILGTVQRLTKLIGYKDSLKAFLLDKQLTFEQGIKLNIFNYQEDNKIKINNRKFLWDQDFANTFIFYNSKIHSIYKNKLHAYNALLSVIFESIVCNTAVSQSIEKRWLKWLLKYVLSKS